MIVIITYTDKGFKYVSHGVDSETLMNVVLPSERLDHLIDKKMVEFNNILNEYVLVE